MIESLSENASAVSPSRWGPRLLLLGLVVVAVTTFFALGLHRELTWEKFQAQRDELKSRVEQDLPLAVAIYCAVYVAITALSLPAATVVSLVGGALFGRWLGTLLVSCSSTIGATLAFLLTRYLFGDFVQRRWTSRLEAINRGIAEDGAFYLLTLRLVPLFPFFVVNAAMGLTRIRVWTYVWVSQLGMLPATFICVNAGTELGQVSEPGDILSWRLWLSLALLGIVPLALRKGVQWGKRAATRKGNLPVHQQTSTDGGREGEAPAKP